MIAAVRYLVDLGIKWRAMPSDFPPWSRVYAFSARWRDAGLVAELREAVRRSEGRSPEPSAGVVDSQSVKADATVPLASRGYDAGKKINGRKRHLLTDTLGILLAVQVTLASTTDRDAARILLPTSKQHFRRLARVWSDGGYTGHLTDWTTQHLGLVLDIVRRSDDVRRGPTGFLCDVTDSAGAFSWASASRYCSRPITRRLSTSSAAVRAARTRSNSASRSSTRTAAAFCRASNTARIDGIAPPPRHLGQQRTETSVPAAISCRTSRNRT
ncbi:transposase [Streptomyces sp. NPDC006385]|uniref:transposase n=1 Tax=Streptomyces sp. NPDC006385 TaxID=3156761 RepID=UPI0033B1B8EF